jgi:ABC-2 type transport system ATP-binding protein
MSSTLVAPAVVDEVEAPIAIRVANLTKRYGDLEAVHGISFDIREREIFGLIGPDGAGKTSTFQVLAGVMEASGGTAEVFGRPARETRSQTGYLTQTFSLYPDLTVLENIRYIGDLRRTPRDEIDRRAMRYLGMFDMDRFTNRLAGRLSGGMKQKLALACALVPQPRVLLLDEPTTGVDPVSRREFWDTLAHLAAEGLTVLVATPYLDEAERCHRCALMFRGDIQQMGTPAELRASLGATRLEVRTRTALGVAEQTLSAASDPDGDIIDVQRYGDRLDVLVRDPETETDVRKRLTDAGLEVEEIRRDEPMLENTFVARLHALGEVVRHPEFPGRHDHQELRGQIAIGASQLVKDFGSFRAVNQVSLQVEYGEVYGLLGANGAGKTTTIKMLCGLLDQTSGSVALAGVDRNIRTSEVRQRVGYMSQKFSLYDDLPVDENLEFFAGVYGVPENEWADKIAWVLSFAGLEQQAHQLVGSLPGGWKQRVAFGAAIMHEPTVLFLDEPTSGVDPVARRTFWSLINRLSDAGTAILVTTHYLEEAEQCNRLGFMVAGEPWPRITDRDQEPAAGTLLERTSIVPAGDGPAEDDDGALAGVAVRRSAARDPAAGNQAEQGSRYADARRHPTGSRSESRFSLEDVFISVVERARLEGRSR